MDINRFAATGFRLDELHSLADLVERRVLEIGRG